MKSKSRLERLLEQGHFVVTAELGPPKGTRKSLVEKRAGYLCDAADAINITDNQTAITRMSSLATSILVKQLGLDPVMQITCRDRNRLAIQADVLGAAAFGINNILALSGDHQSFGNHPSAKNVYDLDSMHLVNMLAKMREEKAFQSGDTFRGSTPIFVGAAANPYGDPFAFRPIRLAKKVNAGADFIQTQAIYNVEKFAEYMKMAGDLGLHERMYMLAGVIPMKSHGMARYMANSVAGMDVPAEMVKRMKDADDAQEEGVQICLEIIEQLREIPGVDGIHIMAVAWEEIVPEVVERAGLMPRPTPFEDGEDES
jgi:methylenetetrahydrofolate reductase (NADPH)